MPRLLSTVIDAVGGNPSLPHMLALSVLIKNRIAIEDEALCVSSRIEFDVPFVEVWKLVKPNGFIIVAMLVVALTESLQYPEV